MSSGRERRRVLGGGAGDRAEPVALFNRFGGVLARGGDKQRRSRLEAGRQEVSFGGAVVEAQLDIRGNVVSGPGVLGTQVLKPVPQRWNFGGWAATGVPWLGGRVAMERAGGRRPGFPGGTSPPRLRVRPGIPLVLQKIQAVPPPAFAAREARPLETSERGDGAERREPAGRAHHGWAPRGNPACRGTFGGRRKAVRDRLALQGGTGDFP